jgi:integrase
MPVQFGQPNTPFLSRIRALPFIFRQRPATYPRVLEHFTNKRARDITPDVVDAFLEHLATERKLSPSSVNHHRMIVNGIFNFAVKRGQFDKNPVAAVRQRVEPPGRDRIVSPVEFRALWDKAEGDREMHAFLALAGTTTMRSPANIRELKPVFASTHDLP